MIKRKTLFSAHGTGWGQDLDVLINCASVFKYDSIKSASQTSWDMNIDSNLRAPFVLTQEFARQVPKATLDVTGEMRAKACIVNMIDQRVRKLTSEYMTYTIGGEDGVVGVHADQRPRFGPQHPRQRHWSGVDNAGG